MAIEFFLASVWLYAGGGIILASVRLYAGGAKTLELQGPCCGSVFFLRRKATEEKKGLGRTEYRFAEYEYDEIRCEARTHAL